MILFNLLTMSAQNAQAATRLVLTQRLATDVFVDEAIDNYCLAADIIAAKCKVPVLYRFELMGTSEDVATVNQGLEEFPC